MYFVSSTYFLFFNLFEIINLSLNPSKTNIKFLVYWCFLFFYYLFFMIFIGDSNIVSCRLLSLFWLNFIHGLKQGILENVFGKLLNDHAQVVQMHP